VSFEIKSKTLISVAEMAHLWARDCEVSERLKRWDLKTDASDGWVDDELRFTASGTFQIG
jgi:hypothetical protein